MPEPVERGAIGPTIRRLRKERGWSLAELARKSGVSRSYLYQIERGESAPTQEKIHQLAQAFGALPSELLGEPPGSSMEIPQSLKEFAEAMQLGSADMHMLARINYRGRRPSTTEEWRAIYSVIKGMLEEG